MQIERHNSSFAGGVPDDNPTLYTKYDGNETEFSNMKLMQM